jgi:hypothetical protein
MRGAFVLKLASETQPLHGRFEGWVEEVDTGRELRFRSTDELLAFLGRCFREAQAHSPERAMRTEDEPEE